MQDFHNWSTFAFSAGPKAIQDLSYLGERRCHAHNDYNAHHDHADDQAEDHAFDHVDHADDHDAHADDHSDLQYRLIYLGG